MKNKPFFFNEGIEALAQSLKGDENIYLGIRPYGFHAGNQVTLIVYPYLLCKELIKLGKTPRFNFFLFLNDWEQDGLAGPNPKKYPFNIKPIHTTFQYTPDPDGCSKSIVDHWQPIIERNISILKRKFPLTNVISVRNSQMKNIPEFKRILLQTIQEGNRVLEILKKFSNRPALKNPSMYASIVCPDCKSAKGRTYINSIGKLTNKCVECGSVSKGAYEDFDYWFYHKTLALPRISIYNIDLCITGSDHYHEGDFRTRKELLKYFCKGAKSPLTLYAVDIMADDGRTMGKSKGNAKEISYEKLVKLIKIFPNAPTLVAN